MGTLASSVVVRQPDLINNSEQYGVAKRVESKVPGSHPGCAAIIEQVCDKVGVTQLDVPVE